MVSPSLTIFKPCTISPSGREVTSLSRVERLKLVFQVKSAVITFLVFSTNSNPRFDRDPTFRVILVKPDVPGIG